MTTSTPRRPRFLLSHILSPILTPIRHRIDRIEVNSPQFAQLICKLIPCTCPFEQQFTVFGFFFHTPPLCELNPFYNEFVALRFRALSYLSDVCGEDISSYIC